MNEAGTALTVSGLCPINLCGGIMDAKIISQEELRKQVHYDPETGEIRRIVKVINSTNIGEVVVGNVSHYGYLRINILGKRYLQHRIAWLYMYGEYPDGDMDHINQVKTDNRICNLRKVTRSQNMQNTGKPKNNTSGTRGIWWRKDTKKWAVELCRDKKKFSVGCFDDINEAKVALSDAIKTIHPYRPSI